jgi:hypothetical protein
MGQAVQIPEAVYEAISKASSGHMLALPPMALRQRPNDKLRSMRLPTYQYRIFDLDLPPGAAGFQAVALSQNGTVSGTLYYLQEDGNVINKIANYRHGRFTVLQEGLAGTANDWGTVGGFVLTDPVNFMGRAALFKHGHTRLLPQPPGSVHSEVIQLNNVGQALIRSFDNAGIEAISFFDGKRVTPLDFGSQVTGVLVARLGNRGIVVGSAETALGYRGFRLDPRTGDVSLLQPLPTETDAWALGINDRGDILGYSFIWDSIERIGIWDRAGKFHVYFVEGTGEVPTISNSLRFNNRRQIVITSITRPDDEVGNSYLLPRPGRRVNLAEHVKDLPAQAGALARMLGINNHGDMFGESLDPATFMTQSFGLERLPVVRWWSD